MPTSQQGAAPGTRDVVRELREHKRLIDQLFRRLSVPPKVAAPAASGGIVGMAEMSATGGTVQHLAGNANMSYASVTYGSPYDPNGGADPSWLSTSGHLLTLSPGWYIPVLYVRLIWDAQADAPLALGPYMGGGDDSVHNDYTIHATTPWSGGRWGLQATVNYGPTYIGDGSDVHAEVRGYGGVPSGSTNDTFSTLLWNITKLT